MSENDDGWRRERESRTGDGRNCDSVVVADKVIITRVSLHHYAWISGWKSNCEQLKITLSHHRVDRRRSEKRCIFNMVGHGLDWCDCDMHNSK